MTWHLWVKCPSISLFLKSPVLSPGSSQALKEPYLELRMCELLIVSLASELAIPSRTHGYQVKLGRKKTFWNVFFFFLITNTSCWLLSPLLPGWKLWIVVVVYSLSCFWLFATPWTIAHRLLCLWDFPGKNAEVGCHFLPQGIFQTQGSNLHLLHCRWILYHWATREALGLWII